MTSSDVPGEPCPYRARVRWGGRVVADSTASRRVDHADRAPELWFPRRDVALDVLPHDEDLWIERNDLVAFDPERVDVELVDDGDPDGGSGDAARDVTINRFPTWGDARDLITLLDVQPDSDGRYSSSARADWRRPVVEGSQILAQSIVAATRHTGGRRPVSTSMLFTRVADARAPLAFELGDIAAGRTFSAVTARAVQGGRVCAAGTLLLDVTAPDIIRHGVAAPAVGSPYDAVPHDMSVTGRDVRIVDDAYTGDPDAPIGPPVLDAWVRFREVPDDPALHAALLAQFTGHLSIGAALRPHAGIGERQAHATLSTAINAINLAIHRDIHADQWMLYHHHSTFAGDGMTHAECRVHDESGEHLASFTVDAMVRGFGERTAPGGRRTAL